jgi:hypothetical protein
MLQLILQISIHGTSDIFRKFFTLQTRFFDFVLKLSLAHFCNVKEVQPRQSPDAEAVTGLSRHQKIPIIPSAKHGSS